MRGESADAITINCHQIRAIFNTYLKSHLKKWFTRDKKKLIESERIFQRLSEADYSFVLLVDSIMDKLEKAVEDISKNRSNAEIVRSQLLDEVRQDRKVLKEQFKELQVLRGDFIGLSDGLVSLRESKAMKLDIWDEFK
jgi:hypothetical protein